MTQATAAIQNETAIARALVIDEVERIDAIIRGPAKEMGSCL
jgi:hypothetical protein